jgi:hypothetical protein
MNHTLYLCRGQSNLHDLQSLTLSIRIINMLCVSPNKNFPFIHHSIQIQTVSVIDRRIALQIPGPFSRIIINMVSNGIYNINIYIILIRYLFIQSLKPKKITRPICTNVAAVEPQCDPNNNNITEI